MSEKKKTRSGQEWLELIQECRTSGLPDREWCRLHSISIKTFHNKVSGLKKVCRRIGTLIHNAYPRTAPCIVGKGATVIIIPAVTVCLTVRVSYL